MDFSAVSFLLPAVFILSSLGTWLLQRYATCLQLVDRPVARSAHDKPTAVSGGLVFSSLLLIAIALLFSTGRITPEFAFAAFAGALVAVVGLIDDIAQLSVKQRLLPQVLSVAWALYWLVGLDIIVPSMAAGLPRIVVVGFLAVAALWLINLYNFMDGIDGLAGSEALFVNAMSLLLVINTADTDTMLVSGLMFAAIAGFLQWNWGNARIFMGDVGSGFIGFQLAVMAIWSMHQGSLSLWTWIILLGVFLVDASVTLSIRYFSGQAWTQGHSCHAYQHLSRRFNSHRKVSILLTAVNVCWLAPLAYLAHIMPRWGMVLAIVAVLPLAGLAVAAGAGRAGSQR